MQSNRDKRHLAIMGVFTIVLVLGVAILADKAYSATTATITPSTQRFLGDPLLPSEIGGYQLYMDGVASGAQLPATAKTVSLPSCAPHVWTLTEIDTAGLASDPSAGYTIVPDKAQCRPKPPALTVP